MMPTSTTSTTKTVSALEVGTDWRVWVPCFGMALCSLLSFVDRQVLGALAPTILKDTGLDARQFAVVNSYFFFAYTLANPIWGSILDYVGLRAGMLMGVFIWTVASVSHGWMTGLMGFAMARALLGFGEGVTFPGGLRTAVESLPASKRARAIALSFSGGTLGGVAAPLIAVPIGVRVRMAGGVPVHRRARAGVDGPLVRRSPGRRSCPRPSTGP